MIREKRRVLAIDGGNSKTDIVLVAEDGTVLATARCGPFAPQTVGADAAVALVDEAVRLALDATRRPYADHLAAYVAGADLPEEEEELRRAFAERGLAREVAVGNDTLALLRAGAPSGWGVAVVCGAGINCGGVAPDGRTARFPSLGPFTGDWGGGLDLGRRVLWHAARAEDGRGPATALTDAVIEYFGTATVMEAAIGLHLGRLDEGRVHGLTPALFKEAAAGDAVARSLADRLAEEVTLLGTVMLRRLRLLDTPADVVLGGGVLASRPPGLIEAIEERYAARAPHARLIVSSAPPVAGAALLGLDALGVAQRVKGGPIDRELLCQRLSQSAL